MIIFVYSISILYMAIKNLNLAEYSIKQVSPDNESVQKLIAKLDKYQIELYGIECCHLDSVAELKKADAYMMGAYHEKILAGIGAVKMFDGYAEIKRMFVEEAFRGSGVAEKILGSLENYARDKRRNTICIETGVHQYAALQFYKKLGYTEIEQFGSYTPNGLSVFLEKKIPMN
jgi:putative acetyltransferase